jgi:REP element-mobilizing transposase RayT
MVDGSAQRLSDETGSLRNGGPSAHRGWHSRGYLPHLDEHGRIQAITFRLADSLPRQLIESWADELARMPPNQARTEQAKRVADALDSGLGACWLRQPELADMVETALMYFDGVRYHLLAWCVMPNHVHVLFEPLDGYALDGIIRSWKTFTAKQCNLLIKRSGTFWARDYFDRFIRDESHLARTADYIENNPVKANLVESPEAWPWSSARKRRLSRTADL